ncbi:Hypothetical protein MOVI_0350 [Mesomycoplasma ovipneumoniae 14811]|uniref:Uncharacterized protein n=1 Tax=Mesomycoplasma ovipneumoniae 14811 TaxID=1188239 RepID=A0A014NRB3_9BACT|nr:Hypothetical protein MOVI_0350 [Mesomycoplasma ovipneumoniae 14811]
MQSFNFKIIKIKIYRQKHGFTGIFAYLYSQKLNFCHQTDKFKVKKFNINF